MRSITLRPVVCHVAGLMALAAATPTLWAQTSVVLNSSPTRVIGHVKLNQQVGLTPNLVEGREFFQPQSVALDTSVTPAILYVSDTLNNRVLAFKNSLALTKGDFADKVIGQRDLLSTLPQGPNSGSGGLSTGVSAPVGIAVDRNGNLYVIDAGNNRILRYPKPLQQTGDLLPVDLLIGQRSFSGVSPNEGNQAASAKTLYFSANGSALRAGLTFDAAGNLWVADAGNNRVLRFPVAQLAANTVEPAADIVLGQTDFVTSTSAPAPNNLPTNKATLFNPSDLAFDQAGRLYVSDAGRRVLFYGGNLSTGSNASRILGLQVVQQGQNPTFPNNLSLGLTGGLVVISNNLFVTDLTYNRISRYDTPESWPAETEAVPSPTMKAVVGQSDFTQGKANRGSLQGATANGFQVPFGLAYSGTDLFVADTFNHRVISFAGSGADLGFNSANRVVGQVDFQYLAPNLVEGRELFIVNGSSSSVVNGGSAIAIDKNSNPPRLYISDSLNNRVLGFKDARNVRPGDKADLVIGQTDLFHTMVNSPSGDRQLPTDTGLFNPVGLSVDAGGNLWIADSGNGRLLRFPAPFAQPSLANQKATVILGQSGFFVPKIPDAGIANMAAPYGVVLLSDGSIAASDVQHNRVLIFRKPAGGDFTNGQAASVVVGQADFSQTAANNLANRLNRPTQIAADTDDRIYVADAANNRIQVFTKLPATGSNFSASTSIGGVQGPNGLAISPFTGELWVADTFHNQVLRYPQYDTLLLNPQPTLTVGASAPVAVGLDAFDNLLVAEGTNRVSLYFQQLTFQNAASYATRALAPGMLAYLYRFGRPFENWNSASDPTAKPWTQTVSDVQVLVNGAPAIVYELIAGRVDFQVPMNAPTSDFAEFQVVKASTGQILGVGSFPMARYDPGFYTSNSAGTGQMAVVNEDKTVNGPGNGAPRGSVVSLYGTGQGFVANAPPDGQGAAGPLPTAVKPRVFIQAVDAEVLYSGLTSFAAGWQINVRIPDPQAAPGMPNIVVVTMDDVPSNIGPQGARITTTIYVK